MALSFLSKRGKLQAAWKYKADGILWRVVIPFAGRLAGEARNAERKEVSFFCLNTASGKPLWQGVSFGEQWWMGIEAVEGLTIFLHKYANPSLPEHKCIVAVDVETGKQMWVNEELKFVCAQESSVFASRSGVTDTQFVQLDARSGEVLREVSLAEVTRARQNLRDRADIKTPLPLFDVAREDSELALLLNEHCDARLLEGPVEYVDHDRLLIFSYHERISSAQEEQLRLRNVLKIVDTVKKRKLLDVVIKENAYSVVPESFFVERNTLYYISERSTLTAVDLFDHTQQGKR